MSKAMKVVNTNKSGNWLGWILLGVILLPVAVVLFPVWFLFAIISDQLKREAASRSKT